ncbi:MAG: ABC transporter permease [Cyanobacteria bacterium P01_G01_bin.49]
MSQTSPPHPSDPKSKPMPVVVYQPDSRLRHPLTLFKDIWRDLLASRELAWQLIQRDIQSKYRQSLLGIIWAFVPPIVTAIGLTFLKEAKILNLGETDIPYPVYVAFSMTLWQTFTQTLNSIMGTARTAKGLLSKLNVPPESFILSALGQILFDFVIGLIPIVFFFLWFKVSITWTLLIAPVAFIHLLLLATGIGLLIGPFSCLYGDISKAMGFVTRFGLFVTPVVYEAPREGIWATLVSINPVTPLLVTTRELATTGVITQPTGFWIASAVAIIITIVGWVFYRISLPFIIERA